MASIEKRPQSKEPWQVRWRDHSGKPRSRQFALKGDAETFKTDVERAKRLMRLDMIDAGRQTVAEVGAEFFAARKPELAPATAAGLKYQWNAHVHDHAIASMAIGSVRPSHVQSFKTDLGAAGVGDWSIRKCLGLLSQVFDRAALDGVVDFNPCGPVKRPSGVRQGDVRVIAPGTVEKIRKEMDDSSAAVVSLMAYGGLRPEELRALRWRHIGAKTIRVEFACNPDGSLRELKGQGGKRRSVPLCAALAGDLLALRGDAKDEALIFNVDGRAWSKTTWDNWRKRNFIAAITAANEVITEAAARADEDPVLIPSIVPYDLRHSIASLWLREGNDPVTVAGWLGHSVAVLQSDYAHVIAELDADDRRSVDEMIAEARKPPTKTRKRRAKTTAQAA